MRDLEKYGMDKQIAYVFDTKSSSINYISLLQSITRHTPDDVYAMSDISNFVGFDITTVIEIYRILHLKKIIETYNNFTV